MNGTPALTKEEYIRLELIKAYISAKADIGTHCIKEYAAILTEAILNPEKSKADSVNEKS